MKKVGTFQGVFIPSFIAISCILFFLLFPPMISSIGIFNIIILITIAYTVLIATIISITEYTKTIENSGFSSIYTIFKNSSNRGFSSVIGILLYCSQVLFAGFLLSGFAIAVVQILHGIPAASKIITSVLGADINQQERITACITCFLFFILKTIGVDFTIKIQMIIFGLLCGLYLIIFTTPLFHITINGWILTLSRTDPGGYLAAGGLPALFVVFFSALAGIDSGYGMTRSLKDSKRSLPKGIFFSAAVTFIIFIITVFLSNFIYPAYPGRLPGLFSLFSLDYLIYSILLIISAVAAGLSAFYAFLIAPRTLQALAAEDVLPRFFKFIEKDIFNRPGKSGVAAIVTFFLVLAVIWTGNLISISQALGIVFLVTCAWINLTALLERFSNNPVFSPYIKGHWMISLYGFIAAASAICLFNIIAGIIIIAVQVLLFQLILKYKTKNRLEGVWWGFLFSTINWAGKKMRMIIKRSKNWRPIVGIFCMSDKIDTTSRIIEIAKKIADYHGLIMIHIFKTQKMADPAPAITEEAKIVELANDDFDGSIISIMQSSVTCGFPINTALIPLDTRINNIAIIEKLIGMQKNVMLYKHGVVRNQNSNRIDIWWKGEENGNFMVLLSFIMTQNNKNSRSQPKKIRLIRKLSEGEEQEKARIEMDLLLGSARVEGEILILPNDNNPFYNTIEQHSFDASLIIMGMLGKKTGGGIARLFALDKLFFTNNEWEKYMMLPPVLFVKAYRIIELSE